MLSYETNGAGHANLRSWNKNKKTTSFNQGQNDRWAASLFCDYGGDSGHNLKEGGAFNHFEMLPLIRLHHQLL